MEVPLIMMVDVCYVRKLLYLCDVKLNNNGLKRYRP